MTRQIDEPSDLTNNERIVLRWLFNAKSPPLVSADFRDVSTASSGRSEWALPILKRLRDFGFVQSGAKIGNASTWEITEAGRAASQAARPAPPRLGDKAKAMLLGPFLNPRSTICFRNEVRTASDEAQEGLRELEYLALAAKEKNGKAETWHLTDAGQDIDRTQLVPYILAFMEGAGNFPLSKALDEPEAQPEP